MLKFLSLIEKKMELAALALKFETAQIYRDILNYKKYLYGYSIKDSSDLTQCKVLMGEKLEDGYKIFYILNDSIVLKKKYNKITKKTIEDFLIEAEKLSKVSLTKNEKSNLDFKQIIHTEIQDEASKSVLYIDGTCSIDEFVNKLIGRT